LGANLVLVTTYEEVTKAHIYIYVKLRHPVQQTDFGMEWSITVLNIFPCLTLFYTFTRDWPPGVFPPCAVEWFKNQMSGRNDHPNLCVLTMLMWTVFMRVKVARLNLCLFSH